MVSELGVRLNMEPYKRIEKAWVPSKDHSSLDDLINEVISERVIRRQSVHSPRQSTLGNLYKAIEDHTDDIVYLVKSGNGLKQILVDLLQPDWKENYFEQEKTIFSRYEISWANEAVSQSYKIWLAQKTSYHDILAHTVKTESRRVYVHEKFQFPLRKNVLQRVFAIAGSIFKDGDAFGKIVRATTGEGSAFFVVYQDIDKRINVLFTKIAPNFILGKTGFCVVQEMLDLKNKRLLAMKYPKQAGNSEMLEHGAETIRYEMEITSRLRKVVKNSYVNLPQAFVEDGEFRGMISHRYAGDFVDFLQSLRRNSAVFIRDFLAASAGLLECLVEFTAKSCVHGDFKPDNIFYEVEGERLRFVLSDFNFSMFFDRIVEDNYFLRHLPKYRVKEDSLVLQTMKASNASKEEFARVIEKQEVYAFGKTLLEMLTNSYLGQDPFEFSDCKDVFISIYGSDLYTFFEGMLRKDQNLRFTFAEALGALQNIQFLKPAELSEKLFSTIEKRIVRNLFKWPKKSDVIPSEDGKSQILVKEAPDSEIFLPSRKLDTQLTLKL